MPNTTLRCLAAKFAGRPMWHPCRAGIPGWCQRSSFFNITISTFFEHAGFAWTRRGFYYAFTPNRSRTTSSLVCATSKKRCVTHGNSWSNSDQGHKNQAPSHGVVREDMTLHWGPRVDTHEELGSRQCMFHAGRCSFGNGPFPEKPCPNRCCG